MSERSPGQAVDARFEFQALSRATNYRAALLREFKPFLRGRVLEVGAGIGQFTAALSQVPAIEELVAVEPEPRFCEAIRRLPLQCTVVEGTVDVLADHLACDAVVSVNVLEHIAQDDEELRKYQVRLAARSGHL